MKNAFVTLSILLGCLMCGLSAFPSKAQGSSLTLTSASNDLLVVELPNYRLSSPGLEVKVERLRPGTHWIRIMKVESENYEEDAFLHLLYEGQVLLQSGTSVSAELRLDNSLVIHKVEQIKAPIEPSLPSRPPYLIYQPRSYLFPDDCEPDNGYSDPPVGMLGCEVAAIRRTILASFDSDRMLDLACKGVAAHGANANQVLEIMRLLIYEDDKLYFAMFAYRFTLDRENYALLKEGFMYPDDKEELDLFIKG